MRENGRVTTRLHPIATFEASMTGYVLKVGYSWVFAIPAQIAKVASPTDATTDARSANIKHRDDHSIVVASHIYNTYNAIATSYAHITFHAVDLTLINGDEIV